MSLSLHRDFKGMDERLWSALPEDIIERVLAFLPIPDLLRFRCVCKPWNLLLSARRPLETFSDSSQQLDLLCLTTVGSHPPTVHVFNMELCKWSELSLSFLPSEMVDISVTASGGGLLYLHSRMASATMHLICNPLTKSWTELSLRKDEFMHVGLLTSLSTVPSPDFRQGASYKIIEAGRNGFTDLSTKVFDSSTRTWSSSGSLPSEVTGFESEGVIINECLYVISHLPQKLLKMELVEGGTDWTEFSAGIPRFAVHPHLVDSMGGLVVVAGIDSCWTETESWAEGPQPTMLKIWKLHQSNISWEEITTLPEELCEKYLRKTCCGFDSLKCAAHGRVIYVATYDGSVVLAYDSSDNSWSRLPECPSLANGLSCMDQFFVFNPSLQSSV